ncbi:MAG: FAD-dependent oxidoreductase, partial [Kangiellaceae bacterium]|nr:FAD-dependent oxidoreductase [Kangiellaceae bacterium]
MSKPIADIAVIGAGIIGTCVAERLQHEGKQVILIDRLGPGESCSKGNAGHFATDIILPLANFNTLLSVPKLLLDPMGP